MAFIRRSETNKATIVIPMRQASASFSFHLALQIDHVLTTTMKIIAIESVHTPCQCTAVVTDTKPKNTTNGPTMWMRSARILRHQGDSVGRLFTWTIRKFETCFENRFFVPRDPNIRFQFRGGQPYEFGDSRNKRVRIVAVSRN